MEDATSSGDVISSGGSTQRRDFLRTLSISSDVSEPVKPPEDVDQVQVNVSLESLFLFQQQAHMHSELGKENEPIEHVRRKRPNYDNRTRALLAKQHTLVS